MPGPCAQTLDFINNGKMSTAATGTSCGPPTLTRLGVPWAAIVDRSDSKVGGDKGLCCPSSNSQSMPGVDASCSAIKALLEFTNKPNEGLPVITPRLKVAGAVPPGGLAAPLPPALVAYAVTVFISTP